VSQGRPPHEPTEQTRIQVKTLAAVGIRHEDIAIKMGICADTLTKYYRQELDEGRIDAKRQSARDARPAGSPPKSAMPRLRR